MIPDRGWTGSGAIRWIILCLRNNDCKLLQKMLQSTKVIIYTCLDNSTAIRHDSQVKPTISYCGINNCRKNYF
jgi:hypothetical protein